MTNKELAQNIAGDIVAAIKKEQINDQIRELARLRSENRHDTSISEIEVEKSPNGTYSFLNTPSHGYLVVPTDDVNYGVAMVIWHNSSFSYKGLHAIYLEEDVDAVDFINDVNSLAETGLKEQATERLEELRQVLRSESISYGELAELAELAPYIEPGDVELLEAAGVPEFPGGDHE